MHLVFSIIRLGSHVFIDVDGLVLGEVHIHNRILLLFAAENSYGRNTARAAAPGRGHARRLLFGV